MDEKQMTLGQDYEGQNVVGWFASEKLNGCRAYWDGRKLWSRGGNIIKAPEWFTEQLPKRFPLDGEIYCGRGRLEEARQAVQNGRFTNQCTYNVFDAPGIVGDWAARMAHADVRIGGKAHPEDPELKRADTVHSWKVESHAELARELHRIQEHGGEGIMLRNPSTLFYEEGRTSNLLKLKSARHL